MDEKSKTTKTSAGRLAGWLFFVLLIPCLFLQATPGATAQSEPATPVLKREKIAVMPFLLGRFGADLSGVLNCPICQIVVDPQSLIPGCDRTLTHYVQEALERRHEDMAVPFSRMMEEYTRLRIDDTKDTPAIVARQLGKRVGADYVLVGNVWRYMDRRGSPVAVESPASVAFALHLVDVASGKILWSDAFSETQRSLSENILQAKGFFEMGGKWLTADEFALYGVKEIFKKFPY